MIVRGKQFYSNISKNFETFFQKTGKNCQIRLDSRVKDHKFSSPPKYIIAAILLTLMFRIDFQSHVQEQIQKVLYEILILLAVIFMKL